MVYLMLSSTHPSIVLQVHQEPSPVRSFLTEMGSWRELGSSGLRGRKMESIDSKRMRRTRFCLRGPPLS